MTHRSEYSKKIHQQKSSDSDLWTLNCSYHLTQSVVCILRTCVNSQNELRRGKNNNSLLLTLIEQMIDAQNKTSEFTFIVCFIYRIHSYTLIHLTTIL